MPSYWQRLVVQSLSAGNSYLCVFKSTWCTFGEHDISTTQLFYNKKSVLISDWLPAVIKKSTDVRKRRQRHATKTLALIFLSLYLDSPVFDLNIFDSLNGKMFQTRNLLGTFVNEFSSFIQSVNLFTSVDSVNHLPFLWPIKTLPFLWRQNKPIRCREKLLIMADVLFSKFTRNNTAHFLDCFTPHFPSKFKALPACRFRFVVKNKSHTVFHCLYSHL